MQLRQNRRRRVLSEESAGADLAADAPRAARSAVDTASAGSALAAYSPAVERVQVRRTLDLLPTRFLTLALLFMAGLAVVAGLEVLYHSLQNLSRLISIEYLAAIDLAGGRSVAHWFSCSLLNVTALIAALIYSLRRHRVDDYHGRYRLWLWTVAALLLMSVDEIAEVHRLGPALLSSAAAWCGIRETQLWGGVLGVAAGILVIRLLFEMRRSKLAIVTLLASAGSLAGATALNQGWIPLEPGSQTIMVEAGLRMVGHLLLFFAITLYARHVVRDAAGLLPARPRKAARQKAAKRERAKPAATADQVDPPQKPQPHFSTSTDLKSAPATVADSRPAGPLAARAAAVAVKSASPAPTIRVDAAALPENRGMTRAERKKLRRQSRQERDSDDD